MATITIEHLTVGYDADPVITDLSLVIPDGALFTLLGPSGCGKTTLLRAMAGFIPVRAGTLQFAQRDVTRVPAHLRDVGMVFQDYALFPDKTVFDNVAYGLRARKQSAAHINATVGEYLERVGLSGLAGRVPAALSGGQRQRVALARALAIKPTLLLMDEPLSNLDAKLRVQVREMISDLQKEVGITTVLVTHDQEEALALSDQIALMRNGALAQIGTPEALYGAPNSTYVADFIGAANTIKTTLAHRVAAHSVVALSLGGGVISGVAHQALDAGEVYLIARPETLTLAAEKSANTPSVSCTIRRRQYLGGHTLYTVALEGGALLRVETRDAQRQWAAGEAAQLQFDATQTSVVAA